MHSAISCGGVTVLCSTGALPQMYPEYRSHALLADEFDLSVPEGELSFFGVTPGFGWPRLVIAQRYAPSQGGFHPGVLFIPETSVLFVGAGERLLAYELTTPRRLWIDHAAVGFWHWHRHEEFVLMAAELEFAVWSIDGQKKWSTLVEPPWTFEVNGAIVTLDVMGNLRSIDLRDGPVEE